MKDITSFSIHTNLLFLEHKNICHSTNLDRGDTTAMHIIYIALCSFLQRMRQEFRTALNRAVTVTSADDEPEPSTSMSTEPHDISLPRVPQTHHQHPADFARLMMEEGDNLIMGKDQAAPLATEVFSPMFHFIHQSSNSLSILHALWLNSSPHFLSGLAKDPSCGPHQEHGRVTSHRCDSTTGSGPPGFSSCPGH